jgi:hypothetical protein
MFGWCSGFGVDLGHGCLSGSARRTASGVTRPVAAPNQGLACAAIAAATPPAAIPELHDPLNVVLAVDHASPIVDLHYDVTVVVCILPQAFTARKDGGRSSENLLPSVHGELPSRHILIVRSRTRFGAYTAIREVTRHGEALAPDALADNL